MTVHLRPSNGEDATNASFRVKPDGKFDPAGETGWFLQRERERLGKSLADAALETGINAKYLNAIETGLLNELPSHSYALGYIRVYAGFLELEADPMVAHYKGLLPAEAVRRAPARRGGLASVVGLIAASMAFVIGLTATVWLLSPGALRGGGEQTVETASPDPVPPVAAGRNTSDTLSTGTIPPPSAAEKQDESADIEARQLDLAVPTVRIKQRGFSDTDNQAAIAPGPSADSLKPGDRTTVERTTSGDDQTSGLTEFIRQHVTEAVESQGADAQSSPGRVYGADNTQTRLLLTANQPVWIRIEDPNGNILITRTLQAGDSYQVPDRKGLVLIARDGGALDYSIDGRPKGAIGAAGEIVVGRSLDIDKLKKASG